IDCSCCCHECSFKAEGGIRVFLVTGVQTCALPIWTWCSNAASQLQCAGSVATAHGNWLAAFEHHVRDGPWVEPADLRRDNALLRYSERRGADRMDVTAMLYDSRWGATDQVPQRAIDSGLIDRFGTLDPTDGGRSRRANLSARLRRSLGDGSFEARAWLLAYRMNLLSNFTWFLDDPVNGDQFEQTDWRRATGGELRRTWQSD